MKKLVLTFLFISSILTISACSTTAKHPTLRSASMPKLIPLRDFIANTKSNYGYKVSPDGKKIAWIAVSGTRTVIHFREIGSNNIKTVDDHTNRNTFGFMWGQDSKTLYFHHDNDGDENYHAFKVSLLDPTAKPIDITPVKGARATIKAIPRNDPNHIFIKHNKRDKTVFDLFRLDLKTNKLELISKNPGDVVNWLIDDDGKLRARYRKINTTRTRLEKLLVDGKTWEKVIEWNFDDSFYVIDFAPESNMLWVISNINRDKMALEKFDLNSKKGHLIFAEKDVDLRTVFISQVTQKPLFASSTPDYPRKHFFDKELANEFKQLKKRFSKNIFFVSSDNSERTVVLTVSSDKSAEHYLYQRDSGKITLLGKHHLSKYESILSTTKAISYKSRDGLTIHGYLTTPKGLEGKRVPMVLKVHGGPWARNFYVFDSKTQFLTNRGYAVLQVNFRGSTGYGKKFRDAAIGEFAGKMHDDLIDGVNWAVSQGIADKNKICISGGSYGGYATLVGMTFTPDVFACGVDVVGMSNLVTLLKNTPPYWKNGLPFMHKFIGNPDIPEQRKDMESRSPLFKVNAVKKPLLIVQGANDPRVKQKESDQIVKALRKSGKEVEYLLFKDEGHGIHKWTNDLIFHRKMEDFLAKHLGGRSAGFDYYEIGALIF